MPYDAVEVVSRFISNPGKERWEVAKWILRNLKGSSNNCLCFGGLKAILEDYRDAYMGGDLDRKESTLGLFFTFAR